MIMTEDKVPASIKFLTWSVGVGNMIKRASSALRKAKGLGRNRIEYFSIV